MHLRYAFALCICAMHMAVSKSCDFGIAIGVYFPDYKYREAHR